MSLDRRIILWSLGTILASALAAFLVSRLAAPEAKSASPSPDHFHQWLHENLNITPEQERILHPYEEAFHDALTEQQHIIRQAGTDLAKAIRVSQADSPQVANALEQLHSAQGEMQKLTLEHFFAMKEHLTPEQGEKLLEWTHDSILHGHHD